MISNEQLLKHLKTIIQFETDIRDEYNEFADKLKDPVVLEKIEYIRDWEIKHIRLAEELIETARGK